MTKPAQANQHGDHTGKCDTHSQTAADHRQRRPLRGFRQRHGEDHAPPQSGRPFHNGAAVAERRLRHARQPGGDKRVLHQAQRGRIGKLKRRL